MQFHSYIALFFTLISASLSSQENNYWTAHQGAKAALTGGAAVANNETTSSVYYNPAALSFVDYSSITVNALTFFLHGIKIENGAGQDLDLEEAYVGVIPQNIYGIIKLKDSEKWTLSYGVSNVLFSEISLNSKAEKPFDFGSGLSGDDVYIANYNYGNKVKEDWYGFGAGYKVNDNFAVGMSLFGIFKTIRMNESVSAQGINYDQTTDFATTLAHTNINEYLYYTSFGFVTKLGLNYRKENLKLGLTLTSPMLNVNFIGKARLSRSLVISETDPAQSDLNQITFQYDVNTVNKKPFTVDLGTTYTFDKTDVSLRVGYHAGIKRYSLLDTKDFVNSSIFDQSAKYRVPETAHKSVTNIGVGVIHKVNAKKHLYFGFNTDFNSYDDSQFDRNVDFVTTISNWDMYNISGGMNLFLKHYQLTFGGSYVWGAKQNYQQLANLAAPTKTQLLADSDYSASVGIDRINLHIGFTYDF